MLWKYGYAITTANGKWYSLQMQYLKAHQSESSYLCLCNAFTHKHISVLEWRLKLWNKQRKKTNVMKSHIKKELNSIWFSLWKIAFVLSLSIEEENGRDTERDFSYYCHLHARHYVDIVRNMEENTCSFWGSSNSDTAKRERKKNWQMPTWYSCFGSFVFI